jgi:beta-glucanase (GH16 family)
MKKFPFVFNLLNRKLKLTFLVVSLLLSGCIVTLNAQTLVWQDNFDSATLNHNNWTYDFGNGSDRSAGWGWGNSELEYYTSRPQNVRIENGNLVIEARQESFGGNSYTSGRIKTEGRIHFMYGTVEARIKMPNVANGLWPALWTLGTVGEVWPQVGEIDILQVQCTGIMVVHKVIQFLVMIVRMTYLLITISIKWYGLILIYPCI